MADITQPRVFAPTAPVADDRRGPGGHRAHHRRRGRGRRLAARRTAGAVRSGGERADPVRVGRRHLPRRPGDRHDPTPRRRTGGGRRSEDVARWHARRVPPHRRRCDRGRPHRHLRREGATGPVSGGSRRRPCRIGGRSAGRPTGGTSRSPIRSCTRATGVPRPSAGVDQLDLFDATRERLDRHPGECDHHQRLQLPAARWPRDPDQRAGRWELRPLRNERGWDEPPSGDALDGPRE